MTSFDAKEYWENRLGNAFDVEGVGYIGLGRCYNKWLYRVRRSVFLRRLKSIRQDFGSAHVLDVGSGTGFYVERWKELGVRRIVGIDITKVAIENLRRLHSDCEFCQVDISADMEGFRSGEFDAISALDVLFHIVDDDRYEKAIGNIYSLLKPGGLFIWSDSFLHGDAVRERHVVLRPIDSIERILLSAGFQIIERRPIFYLMNVPLDTRSRLRRLLWVAISRAVSRSELGGLVIGGCLYPLESLLVSLARESPTTEMMVCRRPE